MYILLVFRNCGGPNYYNLLPNNSSTRAHVIWTEEDIIFLILKQLQKTTFYKFTFRFINHDINFKYYKIYLNFS
jgi:hypothetical protein